MRRSNPFWFWSQVVIVVGVLASTAIALSKLL